MRKYSTTINATKNAGSGYEPANTERFMVFVPRYLASTLSLQEELLINLDTLTVYLGFEAVWSKLVMEEDEEAH